MEDNQQEEIQPNTESSNKSENPEQEKKENETPEPISNNNENKIETNNKDITTEIAADSPLGRIPIKQINKSEDLKGKILQSIIQKAIGCVNQTQVQVSKFLESVLSEDKEKLSSIIRKGLPDDIPNLRSLIWKINLGFLPMDSGRWTDILINKREAYNLFKYKFNEALKRELVLLTDFYKKPRREREDLETRTNKLLLEDISKDINRTHISVDFFIRQVSDKAPKMNKEELDDLLNKRRDCTFKDMREVYRFINNDKLTHSDVLARILFIYCKFAPDISYVQGMNEIVAPIYYVLSQEKYGKEDEDIENIEADTFWSFLMLMDQMKCVFDRTEDDSDKGLKGKGERLKEMIRLIDPQVHEHFVKYDMQFSLFCFRWFILLFAQEFTLDQIISLWDFIFSEDNKFKNVYYSAISIILLKRDKILVSDYSGMVEELQNLDGVDVKEIIKGAIEVEEKFGEKINKIIENDYIEHITYME